MSEIPTLWVPMEDSLKRPQKASRAHGKFNENSQKTPNSLLMLALFRHRKAPCERKTVLFFLVSWEPGTLNTQF